MAVLLAQAVSAAPHKVRVSDSAVTASLLARNAKLVSDYGSFQLLEVEDGLLAAVPDSRAEIVDDFNFIRLNARALDT